MFTSIIDTGDSRMPATAATPALIAQISENTRAHRDAHVVRRQADSATTPASRRRAACG